MWPVGNGGGDDQRVRLPVIDEALFHEARALGQEQTAGLALLFPLKAFQRLDQRIGWGGEGFWRAFHALWIACGGLLRRVPE